MAIEEIGAAGIRDERTRDSSGLGFGLRAKQSVEVFGLETDLSAWKVLDVISQKLRIQFLATKEGADVSMASLRCNLAWGHPQIDTHHGIKPKRFRNLRHGRIISQVRDSSNLVLPMGLEPTTAILETAALPLSYGSILCIGAL